MKQFFSRYSYDSMRMFLDQFAISLFGFCLALTAVQMETDTLLLVFSLASILFYLALIYGVAQRVGAKDRTSVELGKLPFRPFIGALISLLANSLNLVLAGVVTLLSLLPGGNAGMARFAAMFLNGMYQGVYTLIKGRQHLTEQLLAGQSPPASACPAGVHGRVHRRSQGAGIRTGLSTPELLCPRASRRARSFVKRKQEAARKAAEKQARDRMDKDSKNSDSNPGSAVPSWHGGALSSYLTRTCEAPLDRTRTHMV